MTLGGVAKGLGAVIHHDFEHQALVIRSAADEEVGSRGAPGALEPFEVGLVAAGGEHHGFGFHAIIFVALLEVSGAEFVVFDFQVVHSGVIFDFHAKLFSAGIVGVDERLAAAEEEAVGARKMKGTTHGGLEVHALLHHPVTHVVGTADNDAGHGFDRVALGHAQKVLIALFFGVGAGQKAVGRRMDVPDVTRVAAVAPAEMLGRRFQHKHTRAFLAGGNGRAQRRIAAANDEHIHLLRAICCRLFAHDSSEC